jgi:hypothetical protein
MKLQNKQINYDLYEVFEIFIALPQIYDLFKTLKEGRSILCKYNFHNSVPTQTTINFFLLFPFFLNKQKNGASSLIYGYFPK